MYLVESKSGAIGCMLVALVFLGTWPAFLAQLERRGRLPQHTYLDYSLTNFLTAILIALTLGQIGDTKPNTPNFITQLSQVHQNSDSSLLFIGVGLNYSNSILIYSFKKSLSTLSKIWFQFEKNWGCVLIAMAGGVFLGLGNLATQYAWPFVGLSVTEVITSSLAVVLGKYSALLSVFSLHRCVILLYSYFFCFHLATGTSMNYFLDDKINRAEILFPGVGCFLIAVFLGSAVHSSNAADNAAKLSDIDAQYDPTTFTCSPNLPPYIWTLQ